MEIQKFKNRNSVNPNRVTITPENGTAFRATITRDDNPIAGQEGTQLNAENLNNLGDNINECKESIQSLSEKVTALENTINTFNTTTTIIDSDANPSIEITSSNNNKQKTISLQIPRAKKCTSYRNKGIWNSSEEYVNNNDYIDTVSLNGCTYFCKVTNTNITPIDNSDSNTWGLMASRGGDGAVTIVDNLNSTNNSYALSAKQGKYIKDNYSLKESSIYKGTCSTAYSTTSKIVNCPNFILKTGATIDVTFSNASVVNATLNVNGTGAKSIKYQSGNLSLSDITGNSVGDWLAGETMRFIYNGTNYVAIYNISKGIRVGKCSAYSSNTIETKSKTSTTEEKNYLTFVNTNSESSTTSELFTNENISYDSCSQTLYVKNISDGTNTISIDKIVNSQPSQLPIGAIFQSAIMLEQPNQCELLGTDYCECGASSHSTDNEDGNFNKYAFQRLDGSECTSQGIYKEFIQWLVMEKENGRVPVYESNAGLEEAKAKYDRDINETGNCGKFIIHPIEDGEYWVKFPTITRFVQGLKNNSVNDDNNNIDGIGKTSRAGLPNITSKSSGAYQICGWTASQNPKIGAIHATDTDFQLNDGNIGRFISLDFDASRSSAIYGNSQTVQPEATQYPYYMVVANSVSTKVNIDINNIVNDLKTKASKTELQKAVVFKYFAKDAKHSVSAGSNISLMFDDNTTELQICTHGGNILINGGVGCYQVDSGNHEIHLYFDGDCKGAIAASSNTKNTVMSFNYYLTNIPAGNHTIRFVGSVTSGSAIFSDNSIANVTVQEV